MPKVPASLRGVWCCAVPVVEENNWSKAICAVVGAPPGGGTLVPLSSESTKVTDELKVELLVGLAGSVPVLVLGRTLITPLALLPSHSSRKGKEAGSGKGAVFGMHGQRN